MSSVSLSIRPSKGARGEEILDGGGGLPSFPFSLETPDTQASRPSFPFSNCHDKM